MSDAFGSRELLRYVRIQQPQIIDVRARARGVPALAGLFDKPAADQVAWAKSITATDQVVRSTADLRFDYFAHLTITALDPARLPSHAALKDQADRAPSAAPQDPRYRSDQERALTSLVAFELQGDREQAAATARVLAFVDLFPRLAQAAEAQPYPTPVWTRLAIKTPAITPADPHLLPAGPDAGATDLHALARDLDRLWSARNQLVVARRAEVAARLDALKRPSPAAAAPATHGKPARAAVHAKVAERRTALIAASADARDLTANNELTDVLAMDGKHLANGGMSPADATKLQGDVKTQLDKEGIDATSFCQAYEAVAKKADSLGAPLGTSLLPPLDAMPGAACYREHPKLTFVDQVRLLGHADLIRVDETFVKYTAGEISYVENVLAGELRKRRVKTRAYFEDTSETTQQEDKSTQDESDVTTKQDLSSQVSTELDARMNSNVNASANGSGSGKIGPIAATGGASLGANVALGVDSRFANQNSSTFSQEIVKKAIEQTKTTTIQKRTTKATQLYETINSYEINNTIGSDIRARNGIYCFLDKHVCLSETTYGKRLFMIANLRLPGRNLLCERLQRVQLALGELGRKPIFDVSVDQITPASYKGLVARFKAANVSPPPPPVQTISRTYKTDATSANVQPKQMQSGDLAKSLTPFFDEYKRFLITDQVRLPDDYEVHEVAVTVNHGKLGVSVPAFLPLKIAGAAVGTAVTLTAASSFFGPALLVPFGMWQFEYAVSPLLYYNADSSNVSVCIGNETQDASYFFFDPDFLMNELFDALGTFFADSPDLLHKLQIAADKMMTDLGTAAAKVPTDVVALVQRAVDDVIRNVRNVLGTIPVSGDVKHGFTVKFGDLANSLVTAGSLSDSMGALFAPLGDFVNGVIEMFRTGIQNALGDLFAFMQAMSVNSHVLTFLQAAGVRGELPVSIDTVTINPGVTVNLIACLRRTDQALDKWRLETFDSLYQAYLRQVADYESRAVLLGQTDAMVASPGTMRDEENRAIKELVLYALNNYHGAVGSELSLEKIDLFENAIDWDNLSFQLFTYGPTAADVALDKLGVFAGIDARRKAFLRASWAQVMIPVQPDDLLERKVGKYFDDGTFDLESGYTSDELAALYTQIARERAEALVEPNRRVIGPAILPTDFVVIWGEELELPANPDVDCTP